MQFEVVIEDLEKVTRVQMSGDLNEFAVLPDLGTHKSVHLDLGKIRVINSFGTRTWVLWTQGLSPEPPVELFCCPYVFMRQVSMLKGFLPKNFVVHSFYLPFHCEETDEAQDLLMTRGLDFHADGSYRLPKVQGSRGFELVPSVFVEEYLRFLSR